MLKKCRCVPLPADGDGDPAMPNETVSPAAGQPEETGTIGDAIDLLTRAESLNRLIFMAGGSIPIHETSEAITTGAAVIEDVLAEARAILYANIGPKGGAA